MTQPRTMIHRRVDAARAKRNPAVIMEVPSGWVMLADEQVTPGCCLLLPDPVVTDLNSLSFEDRVEFLTDMVLIGDALMETTDAFRIEYEIRPELEPALFARITPRYRDEPGEYLKLPIAAYYAVEKKLPPNFDAERDAPLMKKIANSLMGKY